MLRASSKGHTAQRGWTWTFWVDIGVDEDGRRQRPTKGGFATKREAERALAKMIADLSDGTYFEHTRETLSGVRSKVFVTLAGDRGCRLFVG